MPRVTGALLLIVGLLLSAEAVRPPMATAHPCACRDVNDDGVCDGSDVAVSDSEWLGGAAFIDPINTFLIPGGCNHTLAAVPKGGVRVTARRVVIGGQLAITASGGSGVLFTALEDIALLPGSQIVSGGVNSLSTTLPANIAIARASVGLKAGTSCTLLGTSLQGNPVTGSGQIGIQCGRDIRIEGSDLVAAGVDIHSLDGRILGRGGAGSSSISLLQECDARGNQNGLLDDGDFPCAITFPGGINAAAAGKGAIASFCSPPNAIQTSNNPLVMVSRGDLDLGHAGPGHVVLGAYKVQLYAEDGDVDVSHATIANAFPPASPPSGAYIELAASPLGITRHPPLKEAVSGPYTGSVDVTETCLISKQAVRLRGTAVGVPAQLPCLEAPAVKPLPPGAGAACDAAGNQNGLIDADDFPCTITFTGTTASALAQAQAFCGETPGAPDVAITKSASPDPVVAGGILTYTISVANVGATTASNVIVSDPLPAGTTFVSCSASRGTCSAGGGGVSASLGTLPPAATAVVTLKIIAPGGNPCGPITNVATVSTPGETSTANNSAQAVTACKQGPDLAITKVGTPDPVRAGDRLTYTITVQNVGETSATGVAVSDTLPPGTGFSSCRASQGTCTRSGSTVTASIGTLAPGASATVTLIVTAPGGAACGTIVNVATVRALGDTQASNDTAEVSTRCVHPDVAIAKTATPDPVSPGGRLTYTITVRNVSPVTGSSIVMADALPAGTAFVSCASSQGACSLSGRQVRATIGTLEAGASATVTLVVTAPATSPCGPITNVATVTATREVNTTNNTAEVVTRCNPVAATAPDVAITKVDTPDPVSPGGPLTYTLTVRNVGTASATSVTVNDPLPAPTSFVSCVASQGTCTRDGGTVTASLGTLDPGASAVVTLVVTAPAGSPCGPISNVATVTAASDSDPSNNTAQAVTACAAPGDPGGPGDGAYCSFSQGGFGNTGSYAQKTVLGPSFGALYPAGITVGHAGDFRMSFSSAAAVAAYLPATETPGVLATSAADPATTDAGVFGGQVLTLRLARDLSEAGVTPAGFGGLKLCNLVADGAEDTGMSLTAAQAAALNGRTVDEILADAESVLGGKGTTSAYGLSVAQLNALTDLINLSFDAKYADASGEHACGGRSLFAIAHLCQ